MLRSHIPLSGDPVVVDAVAKPMPSLQGALAKPVPHRVPRALRV